MIIKKLHLENIRSYKELELEFKEGATLLSGNIGSGKTSVLLGIQFALFGLQPGQKGSSILRSGEDEAYARIEIEVDGETINIERTIKKSKTGSITQEKNILTVRNERRELSTSEMKTHVIALLQYPKEFAKKSNLLYKFTVYTPQEAMKEIVEERPEIRLDTIRHIFGIDRYKRIKENASIILQRIKDTIRIKEVLTGELSLLKEKLKNETEAKIALVRETNNLEYQFKVIQEELTKRKIEKDKFEEAREFKKQTESEIQKNKALIEGKKALESRLKKEITTMQREVSMEIDFSQERLTRVTELIKEHTSRLEEITKRHMALQNRISVLEAQKEKPLHLKETVTSLESCPVCHQIVSQEHKDKITKKTVYELEEINAELEQKYVQKTQSVQEMESEKNLIKKYMMDQATLQKNKLAFEHQTTVKTKMHSDVFVLERTTQEIEALHAQTTRLEALIRNTDDEAYTRAAEAYEKAAQELRREEILLATKNKELELQKKNVEDLSQEIAKKEHIRSELVYLRELQDWMQEKFLTMITITEKNVLSKIKEEFSSIFADWFSMLVSPELTVRLDEDFTPIITNKDYDMDYSFLSGGERTAIALSYRLALNQVLNSMLSRIKTKDLVILDEPTDGFSSEQIDKMRDLFEQLNTKQLIIVSHEEKIEGFVDHVIKVSKGDTSIIDVIAT